jgi:hypothetical protein
MSKLGIRGAIFTSPTRDSGCGVWEQRQVKIITPWVLRILWLQFLTANYDKTIRTYVVLSRKRKQREIITKQKSSLKDR